MFSLWVAELQKLKGRRGLFWGAGIAVTLPAVGFLIARIVMLARDGDSQTNIVGGSSFSLLVGLICSVLAAAIIGSWDQSRGTARYMLMSGVTRFRMMVAQLLGVITYCLAICAYPILLFLLLSWIVPGSSGGYEKFWNEDVLQSVIPVVVMAVFAYSIGLAIGEVGATVAISLVTYFALMIGGPLLGSLLGQYSWIEHIFLFDAIVRLFEPGKLLISLLVIFCWLGGGLTGAWFLLRRREF